jgi:prepilin-type N-terminal cleavage/methylation domain-containing protein
MAYSSSTRVLRAFSLIELLIVLSMISILSAILLPVFAQTREQARRTTCVENSRRLMAAVLLYAQDYDEKLSILSAGVDARGRWMWQIKSYVKDNRILTCPDLPANNYDGSMWSDKTVLAGRSIVGVRTRARRPATDIFSQIGHPAQTILIGDTGYSGISGWAMYRRPPWDIRHWVGRNRGRCETRP